MSPEEAAGFSEVSCLSLPEISFQESRPGYPGHQVAYQEDAPYHTQLTDGQLSQEPGIGGAPGIAAELSIPAENAPLETGLLAGAEVTRQQRGSPPWSAGMRPGHSHLFPGGYCLQSTHRHPVAHL